MDNLKNTRIKFLDVAKGVGIILALLGHTYEIPSSIHLLIYAFHMPMFFVLSGYVFNTRKYEGYSVKRFLSLNLKRYIFYYWFFVICNIVIELIWKNSSNTNISEIGSNLTKWILSSLYCYPFIDYMPNCSPIWFLICLFGAELYVWIIYRYFNGKAKYFVEAVFISAILSYTIDFQLPLEIAPTFMASGFMFLGIKMRELKVIEWLMQRKKIWIFIFVIGIMAAIMNNEVTMAENVYGNIILFVIAACLMSLFVICVCALLSEKIECKLLSFLGKNTIVLIGFNYFLRNLSIEIYYLIPVLKNIQITWKWNFVITFILSIGTCVLWNRRRILNKCL